MKGRILLVLLVSGLSGEALAQADLCTKFIPASNKQFNDTFNLNQVVVTRAGKYIRGSISHSVGKTVANATFNNGNCVNNQLTFSWTTSAFYGTFTGTLVCLNQIYNLVNAAASVNGAPVTIGTMVSPATGQPCPKNSA